MNVVQHGHASFDLGSAPRPVVALAREYSPGFHGATHTHADSQLLYASSGVILVATDHAGYVVSPRRAVWLPQGVPHSFECRGHVSLRTRRGRDGRVMDLILSEIGAPKLTSLYVTVPGHDRVAKVCRALLRDPALEKSLDEWARWAGMGRRTFIRLFRRETGLSFADWRRRARLMEAVTRLSSGHPITTVAISVGYNSASAFTAMFRRVCGVAPSRYVAELAGARDDH